MFRRTSVRWADAFACTQRGSTRNPLVDCGNGTHRFTRGSTQVPTVDWDAGYAVSLPISDYARVVDIHGRPLGQPYRTSTGHWTLNAQPQYHGWLWTVEWDITGVAGPGRQDQYSPPVYARYSPTARSTDRLGHHGLFAGTGWSRGLHVTRRGRMGGLRPTMVCHEAPSQSG